MLQTFEGTPEVVLLREMEKWTYARSDFWTFRQCIHPQLIVGAWPREVSRHLQKFHDQLIAGERPKLVVSSPPQHGKSLAVTRNAADGDPRAIAAQRVNYSGISESGH
jgi:hypothetical protein